MLSWKAVKVVFRNILYLAIKIPGLLFFPLSFLGLPRGWVLAPGVSASLFVVLIGLCVPAGAFLLIKEYRYALRLLDIYLVLYLILFVMIPFPDIRYLVPIFPLLGVAFYRILYTVWPPSDGPGRRLGRKMRSRVLRLILALSGLLNLAGDRVLIQCNRVYGYAFVPALDGALPSMKTYQASFQWIRSNIPPGAVLFGSYDPMFFLYTDRAATLLYCFNSYDAFYAPESPPVKALVDQSESTLTKYGGGYIVVIPAFDTPLVKVITALHTTHPGCLRLVLASEEHAILIYQMVKSLGS